MACANKDSNNVRFQSLNPVHPTFLADEDGPRSRNLLLRAGLGTVAQRGIDHSTASEIISRAGVSRPTFYSYFDDVPGLAADVWVHGGRNWFEAVLWDRLPDGFADTDEHHTYMDILMSASRTPELGEVVQPTMQHHWERIRVLSDSEQVRLLWTLATVLGISVSESVMPSVRTLESFVEGMRMIPAGFEPPSEVSELLAAVAPTVRDPLLPGAEDVTSRLIDAAIRVVAASGVVKASMTRVCRAAHVTTGTAKPRFHDVAELMSRGYDHAVAEVSRQNVEQAADIFGGVSPIMAYTRLVLSSLSPQRRLWRRYRQEMHLAARTSKDIREQMSRSIERTNAVLVGSLRTSGVSESIIDISIRVNQAQSVGFSLIDDLGIPVRDVNHAVIPALISVEIFAALDS